MSDLIVMTATNNQDNPMTDTEINALIAELSTSDTFPQFESVEKALIRNYTRPDGTETSLNATPEAISVSIRLFDSLSGEDIKTAGTIISRVMFGVLPMQAHSLWISFLTKSQERKDWIMRFQTNKAFCTVLGDYVYRKTPRKKTDLCPYNLDIMTDEEYSAHISFATAGPSNEEMERHKDEMIFRFPA